MIRNQKTDNYRNRLSRTFLAGTCSAGIFAVGLSLAQSPLAPYVDGGKLPILAKQFLNVLGDRMSKPGKERVTLLGTFTDSSGTTQAQLIWQAPGSVKLLRDIQSGKALIYNAADNSGVIGSPSPSESDVLETFADDTAEAFLFGFQNGSTYRLLARQVRTDDGKTSNYQGPWYDVYVRTASAKTTAGNPKRARSYLFSSQTGFLAKTQYINSAGTFVRSEFTNWTQFNGQPFPGTITRIENGSTVFSFVVSSALASPGANDAVFTAQ